MLKVLGLSGGDRVESWESSDTDRAVVQGRADGTCIVIAGSKTGRAVITAGCASGRKVVFRIKVQKKKVKTKSFRTASRRITMYVGQTKQLDVQAFPVTTVEKVKYSSKKRKVVSVTGTGILTAKARGTATIVVKSGKKTVRIKVVVS